jgi:hypothetical protein
MRISAGSQHFLGVFKWQGGNRLWVLCEAGNEMNAGVPEDAASC